MTQLCDIGLIGLEVMGQNLVLNMEEHGFRVAVWNRTVEKTTKFMDRHARGKQIEACVTPAELVGKLRSPRLVMLMVQAAPVDTVIEQLIPLLSPGDVIIDGGNSHFNDSQRRAERWRKKGCYSSGQGCPAVRRGRGEGRASCRAAVSRRGPWSGRSCRRSPPKWAPKAISLAAIGSGRTARATT